MLWTFCVDAEGSVVKDRCISLCHRVQNPWGHWRSGRGGVFAVICIDGRWGSDCWQLHDVKGDLDVFIVSRYYMFCISNGIKIWCGEYGDDMSCWGGGIEWFVSWARLGDKTSLFLTTERPTHSTGRFYSLEYPWKDHNTLKEHIGISFISTIIVLVSESLCCCIKLIKLTPYLTPHPSLPLSPQ